MLNLGPVIIIVGFASSIVGFASIICPKSGNEVMPI